MVEKLKSLMFSKGTKSWDLIFHYVQNEHMTYKQAFVIVGESKAYTLNVPTHKERVELCLKVYELMKNSL